jgi:hypothetical protein
VLSTALLAVSVLLLGSAYPERLISGHNDFLQLYSGAALLGTPDLYSFKATEEFQVRSTGVYLKGVYYSRPPFYALLLSPLSRLTYSHAYWVFQGISLLSYALFVLFFSSEHPRYAIWAPLFLPLLVNYLNGQDLALVLLFAALFVKFAMRGDDVPAGLSLSLCLIKFHLFLFVPLVLLVQGRRRLFYAAALAVTGWLFLSFVVAGMDWPVQYAKALSSPEIHPGADHMPTLVGVLKSSGIGTAGLLTASTGAALLTWAAIRRVADFSASLGLALLAGLVLAPHAYVQDCALLLLILPLLSPRCTSLSGRVALIALMTPVPYLLLLRGAPGNIAVPALLALVAVFVYREAAGYGKGSMLEVQPPVLSSPAEFR